MIDNIRFVLQYWKLKSYLCEELGYTKAEAAHTIGELRKMEPNILSMFLTWFRSSDDETLPQEPVNGARIQEIMEHCSMNPIAAFLALNWMQTDPTAAKYALSRPVHNREITESDREALRRIAQKRGWDMPEEAPEDTSDLIEPKEE